MEPYNTILIINSYNCYNVTKQQVPYSKLLNLLFLRCKEHVLDQDHAMMPNNMILSKATNL